MVSRQPEWSQLWWIEFPMAGRRPGLVLNRPEAARRLDRLLVAPASTRVRGLVTEVHLDETDGMPKPCVLQLDTPELVVRERLDEFIVQLGASRWYEVCAAMSAAINC